jgi:hypothetical protein
MTAPRGTELQRVTEEIVGRLAGRGIRTTAEDAPDEIVRLLDAVEEFERAVQRKGGDLMVDEPIGAASADEPDNRSFVLPTRNEGERIREFIDRMADARARAERAD